MQIYVIGREQDSDPIVAGVIEELDFEVKWFMRREQFFAEATRLLPGCALVHFSVDDVTPGQFLRDMRKICSDRHEAIFLSGACDIADAVSAMREGAVDFLEKPLRRRELAKSIQRGYAALQHSTLKRRRDAQDAVLLKQLTPAEVSVLQASSDGQSSKEAANDLGLSVRTVEMHRSNIIKKLNVRNFSAALVLAEAACLLDHS